jgi:hypothetical protein
MNREALDAAMEKAQRIAQNWPACMRDQRVGYPSERHHIRETETQDLWRKSEMSIKEMHNELRDLEEGKTSPWKLRRMLDAEQKKVSDLKHELEALEEKYLRACQRIFELEGK